jgi:hypothetical protein
MPADQHKRPTVYGDNEFVVNYNDAVIYGKDLGLLESNTAWLNDGTMLAFTTNSHVSNRRTIQIQIQIQLLPSPSYFLILRWFPS